MLEDADSAGVFHYNLFRQTGSGQDLTEGP